MRNGQIALLALAGLSVLAFASAASASDGPDPGGDMTRKQIMWAMLESVDAFTPTQRYALMLIARREGGYNPAAHNGSPQERAAADQALANNPAIKARALACGVPLENLESGSWTTFQLLAPYASGTAYEVFGDGFCPFADPTKLTNNLAAQIALAVEHARDLQGYDGFKAWPTVGALYLGWGSPGRMGADAPTKWKDKLDVYRAVAKGEKFPPGIVDAQLTRFPSNPAQIYAQLVANT